MMVRTDHRRLVINLHHGELHDAVASTADIIHARLGGLSVRDADAQQLHDALRRKHGVHREALHVDLLVTRLVNVKRFGILAFDAGNKEIVDALHVNFQERHRDFDRQRGVIFALLLCDAKQFVHEPWNQSQARTGLVAHQTVSLATAGLAVGKEADVKPLVRFVQHRPAEAVEHFLLVAAVKCSIKIVHFRPPGTLAKRIHGDGSRTD